LPVTNGIHQLNVSFDSFKWSCICVYIHGAWYSCTPALQSQTLSYIFNIRKYIIVKVIYLRKQTRQQ